ncbi:MAG TPA: site-2 protease family protein [Actinomycetota bacterium]|nr:site-2 protease family protein [Actinomycetota bacterium]
MALGILYFVLGIFLMILVHEAGHFFAARAFRIKVEEFFIGFGPRLWSIRRGETEYGLKALPLGGYVRIAGMNPFQEPAPEDLPRTFGAKPKWQRAVVLVAGGATHFLLAFILLVLMFGAIGVPRFRPVVQGVEPRLEGVPSPAVDAGLRPGDEILAVDGRPVDTEAFPAYIDRHVGEPVTLLVERGGERITVRATPVPSEVEGRQVGRLGIRVSGGEVMARDRAGPVEAVASAFGGTEQLPGVTDMVGGSFRAMASIFGPEGLGRITEVLLGERERSVQDPIGVVGAARVSGQAVAAGQIEVFFFMFAFFNVFVGILNLLPLPPLDGGHLAVLGLEAALRRPIDPRKLVPVSAVVATFLILFTVAILYLDVTSPVPNLFR